MHTERYTIGTTGVCVESNAREHELETTDSVHKATHFIYKKLQHLTMENLGGMELQVCCYVCRKYIRHYKNSTLKHCEQLQ